MRGGRDGRGSGAGSQRPKKKVRYQGRGRPAQTPVPDDSRVEPPDKSCAIGLPKLALICRQQTLDEGPVGLWTTSGVVPSHRLQGSRRETLTVTRGRCRATDCGYGLGMVGGVVERARWRDVFGHAEFRALFLAGVLSVAGDQLARVALSVLVFERTESAGLTALTYALTYVPDLVFGPFAGRYRRPVSAAPSDDHHRPGARSTGGCDGDRGVAAVGQSSCCWSRCRPSARRSTRHAPRPCRWYCQATTTCWARPRTTWSCSSARCWASAPAASLVVAVGHVRRSAARLRDLPAVRAAHRVRRARRPAPALPSRADEPRRSYFADLAAGTSLVIRTPQSAGAGRSGDDRRVLRHGGRSCRPLCERDRRRTGSSGTPAGREPGRSGARHVADHAVAA